MYIVVCYDISDHRRRARLHEEMLGFGTPVQKSVFECQLTPSQFRQMKSRTRRYARKPTDSIRYYQLCGKCAKRTHSDGTALIETDSDEDYVVT
jgi:CRISPR-associated protein Cas2